MQCYSGQIFVKSFFIVILLQFPSFFCFALLRPAHLPLPQSIPTLLSMSMGHSCMFFVQSLSLLSTITPPTVPLVTFSLYLHSAHKGTRCQSMGCRVSRTDGHVLPSKLVTPAKDPKCLSLISFPCLIQMIAHTSLSCEYSVRMLVTVSNTLFNTLFSPLQ